MLQDACTLVIDVHSVFDKQRFERGTQLRCVQTPNLDYALEVIEKDGDDIKLVVGRIGDGQVWIRIINLILTKALKTKTLLLCPGIVASSRGRPHRSHDFVADTILCPSPNIQKTVETANLLLGQRFQE